MSPVRRLTVNVDGGARGNPGPAAIGVVVRNGDGEVRLEVRDTPDLGAPASTIWSSFVPKL